MKQKKGQTRGSLPTTSEPINYAQTLSTTNQSTFEVHLSIHRVRLYALVPPSREPALRNRLKDHQAGPSRMVPNRRLKYGRLTGHVYPVEVMGHGLEVILARSANSGYYRNKQPLTLTVLDADSYGLLAIQGLSRYLVTWIISEVEFVFDLKGCNVDQLFDFLVENSLYKYRRSVFNDSYVKDGTLYYTDQYKTTTSAGKAYKRPPGNPEYIRLEITGKRPFFERYGINTILDLLSCRPEWVAKYLSFRIFDQQAFHRFLGRQVNSGIMTKDQARGTANEFKQILKNHGLNDANDYARKLYDRYLLTKHPVHDLFHDALRDMSFSKLVRWKKDHNGEWVSAGWVPDRRIHRLLNP